jgi:hypothetical protein
MKKILVIAVALLMVTGLVGIASAANSLKAGSKGIGVGLGNSIFGVKAAPGVGSYFNDVVDVTGKYFISNDMALLGTFGLQSDGSDADATYFSFGGGVRKYLEVDDFAPFVQAKFQYISVQVDPDIVDDTIFDLSVGFGAEYFFNKQFSVEGSVGVGLGIIQDDVNNFDDRYFGTRTMGVSANFYF